MKVLFTVMLLCLTAFAVEWKLDIETSWGEKLSGTVHDRLFVMRTDGHPSVHRIRDMIKSDFSDLPRDDYRTKGYVVEIEGVGTICMFPVGKPEKKEGRGSCQRGVAYVKRPYSWVVSNMGYEALKRKPVYRTKAIWSRRSPEWDVDNGPDPVWGGYLFLRQEAPAR